MVPLYEYENFKFAHNNKLAEIHQEHKKALVLVKSEAKTKMDQIREESFLEIKKLKSEIRKLKTNRPNLIPSEDSSITGLTKWEKSILFTTASRLRTAYDFDASQKLAKENKDFAMVRAYWVGVLDERHKKRYYANKLNASQIDKLIYVGATMEVLIERKKQGKGKWEQRLKTIKEALIKRDLANYKGR